MQLFVFLFFLLPSIVTSLAGFGASSSKKKSTIRPKSEFLLASPWRLRCSLTPYRPSFRSMGPLSRS